MAVISASPAIAVWCVAVGGTGRGCFCGTGGGCFCGTGRNSMPWLSVCDLWERGHGPAAPRTRWAPVQPGEPRAAPRKARTAA